MKFGQNSSVLKRNEDATNAQKCLQINSATRQKKKARGRKWNRRRRRNDQITAPLSSLRRRRRRRRRLHLRRGVSNWPSTSFGLSLTFLRASVGHYWPHFSATSLSKAMKINLKLDKKKAFLIRALSPYFHSSWQHRGHPTGTSRGPQKKKQKNNNKFRVPRNCWILIAF